MRAENSEVYYFDFLYVVSSPDGGVIGVATNTFASSDPNGRAARRNAARYAEDRQKITGLKWVCAGFGHAGGLDQQIARAIQKYGAIE